VSAEQVGAAYQVYRMPSTGTIPKFGAIDLSQSAATTNQLPVAKGGTGLATITSGSLMIGNGTGTPTLIAPSTSGNVLMSNGTTWASTDITGPNTLRNVGLSVSISTNTLVIALKQSDGSTNCSSSAPCMAGFRGTTVTNGDYQAVSFTAANSITLGTTDSIGNPASNANATFVYVYLIQDTTSEVCASRIILDEGVLQSATALTGGAETTYSTLYCTNAHTSRPVRLIGKIGATWSNPNWGTINSVKVWPFDLAEYGSFSTTCTNIFTANQTITTNYAKRGRMVTLDIEGKIAACNSAGQPINCGNTPDVLTAAGDAQNAILQIQSSTVTSLNPGIIRINGTAMQFYRDAQNQNFGNTGNCGWGGRPQMNYVSAF
jgi:hypothetical protein